MPIQNKTNETIETKELTTDKIVKKITKKIRFFDVTSI